MSAITMQKQSSRNLVLSPKIQTSYGTALAANLLTIRQRFDPASVFTKTASFRGDKMAAGKGSEWGTNSQITSWDVAGTIKSELDAQLAGWMLSLIFGAGSDTGSGAPYTHNFTVPAITATMPATTIYVEETAAVKYTLLDMAASALSLTVPERGAIMASLDMVGTGQWTQGAFGSALPAIVAANYLLGSDFTATITPTPSTISITGTTASGNANITSASSIAGIVPGMSITGAGIPANTTVVSASGSTVVISANATASASGVSLTLSTAIPFSGRQKNLSIKVERGSTPFKASGDGLRAGSVASGTGKFSVDLTIAALATDDVNAWFENGTALSVSLATNPALNYQLGFNFPNVQIKANKLGNTEDKVMWGLSWDETTAVASSGAAAISAFNIDNTPAYLIQG